MIGRTFFDDGFVVRLGGGMAYRIDLAAMDPRCQNGLDGLDQPVRVRGK